MDFYRLMQSQIIQEANVHSPEELQNYKYFMTFHGKSKSFWYFKFLPAGFLKQIFFDGENNQEIPLYFDFYENKIGIPEFCLVGELITDNYSNQIFLIQDIYSLNTIKLNLYQKHQIIHNFLETVITTSMDPFLFQVKILYNNDSQMLDLFFKTILVSYNVNLEGIIMLNEYGYEIKDFFRFVESRNRVDLDLAELEEFMESMTEIKIVNHLLDFKESHENLLPFKHNEVQTFYTKKDKLNPDIYYLYPDPQCEATFYLALIPSLEISIKMNRMPSEFTGQYSFHEFHQKWIPIV